MKQRFTSRKSERGTTVLVTVMVTTLITAIGMLAIRNIGKIDQAVGYSRLSAQTLAVAEMGTTAALAQIAVVGADYYATQMDRGTQCGANGAFPLEMSTCYRMRAAEIEGTTTGRSGSKLFEPAVAGSETGSFGPSAGTMGFVSVEMTEKYKTSFPVPGAKVGETSYVTVTMTATGNVRPVPDPGNVDECAAGAALATSKKVMRAHTVIGPLLTQ